MLYRVGIYIEKTLNKKYFLEPDRRYIEPEDLLGYDYYDGYWQSYRYVDYVADKINTDFIPNKSLSDKSLKIKAMMKNQNSVFVGVRRGDYVAETKHYGTFSEEYFLSAMQKLEEKIDNPVYYIFSNDIAWCKDNIHWGQRNIVYREKEDQTDDFEELILMSSCKHAIIINSSYHWWGAKLIDNPEKIVICPSKWFFDNKPIDIIPPQWIKEDAK